MTSAGILPVGGPFFVTLAIASTYLLLIPVKEVSSTIVVINADDSANDTMDDWPANFGMSLVDLTMLGAVQDSDPNNYGCIPDKIPPAPLWPPFNDTRMNWFIVVMRGNCTFAQKAINIQAAGYDAMIVRNEVNRPDRSSLVCGPPFPCENITIYVTLVSNSDGRDLATIYAYSNNFSVSINGTASVTYLYYVLPFIVVVGVVLLVVVSFFLFRFIRECRIARKARLTRWALRKIPTRKFKKGTDHYDCCSICLDDFVDGEKLRILPCDHAYHMKCIDPWLLNNRRNCPVCKRRVRVPGETDSDDEESGLQHNASPHNHGHQNQNQGGGVNLATDGVNGNNNNNTNNNEALAIAEGRQNMPAHNDGAPLIRRESGAMTCCIPRSYHSTESLSTPNVAVTSSSLPNTLPSVSQASGSDVGVVSSPQSQSGTSTTAASVVHPVPTTSAHFNTACSSSEDEASQTDTSSVSCTDVSYVDDPRHAVSTDANINNNNTTTSSTNSDSTLVSDDHVVVQIVGGNTDLPQDPGAV